MLVLFRLFFNAKMNQKEQRNYRSAIQTLNGINIETNTVYITK